MESWTNILAILERGFGKCLADLGKARVCSTNTFVINSLNNLLSHILVRISLWCHHAQTVGNGASSHKTHYIFSEILSLKWHLNRCIGSKVTPIWLNG